MHTAHVSDAELAEAHLEQTDAIEASIAAHGPHATVCVLREGPQTVPYIRG